MSRIALWALLGESPLWLIALSLPVALGAVAFAVFRVRRALALNNEGLSCLAEGRHSQALAKFLEAQKVQAASQAPLFHYNIGVTRLSLWQLPVAAEEFRKARKPRWGTNLLRLVLPSHALSLALSGNSAEAERTLEEAGKLGLASHAVALLTSAVLAARTGQWPEVERLVRRQEVKQLGGMLRALADALFAWAVKETGGRSRYVDAVTLFGEAGPSQVQQHWPELVTFLESAPQE